MRAFDDNGGKRIVMAGTCAEYDWQYGRCHEDSTPLLPVTLYGTCKHALQMMLTAWSRETGVASAWGRIFSLYGPHEHPARLVSSVTRSLLRGEKVLCTRGTLVRDYLHVADAGAALVALLDSDLEGPVNIASGCGVALKDIVSEIGSKVGRPDLVGLDTSPMSTVEVPLLVADITRLARTSWRPTFDLSTGLDDTIAWWSRRSCRTAEASDANCNGANQEAS